jgi:CheY-like chemotaxis protein
LAGFNFKDVQMPEMNGLEATQQSRYEPNLANILIIVLTALAMRAKVQALVKK